MRLFGAALAALLLFAADTFAQPALTGRVVDEAGLLSDASRARLDTALEAHERATSNQVVVATVRSLSGRTVEEYANSLFRSWALGQRGKDNGVLLLVAPSERRVRIEVGYGLEGTLTDAQAALIIQREILPRFREGRMEAGVVAGAEAVLAALGGSYKPPAAAEYATPAASAPEAGSFGVSLAIFIVFLIVVLALRRRRGRYYRRGGSFPIIVSGGGWGGGGSGSSGGGFSGGGGSSGGGGASGSW